MLSGLKFRIVENERIVCFLCLGWKLEEVRLASVRVGLFAVWISQGHKSFIVYNIARFTQRDFFLQSASLLKFRCEVFCPRQASVSFHSFLLIFFTTLPFVDLQFHMLDFLIPTCRTIPESLISQLTSKADGFQRSSGRIFRPFRSFSSHRQIVDS